MTTWHQDQKKQKYYGETTWNVVDNPPNGMACVVEFSSEEAANSYAAKAPYRAVLPPAGKPEKCEYCDRPATSYLIELRGYWLWCKPNETKDRDFPSCRYHKRKTMKMLEAYSDEIKLRREKYPYLVS